jgi:hypothetical protein
VEKMLVFVPVIGIVLAILGVGVYAFLPLLLPIIMTTLPGNIAIPPIDIPPDLTTLMKVLWFAFVF